MFKEPDPVYHAPEWFTDNNISLYGEERLAVGHPSKIQTVAADLLTGEPLAHTTPPTAGPPPHRGPKAEDETAETTTSRTSAVGLDGAEEAVSDADAGHNQREIPAVDQAPARNTGDRRYYIIDEQYQEVERTARGLMPVRRGQDFRPESGALRSHLLLQYAGKDGDLLLDSLIEELARNLGCDLLALDAQDMAELIVGSYQQPEVAAEGRMLSYDVFGDAFGDVPESLDRQSFYAEDDDAEMADHFEESPTPTSMGTPVIIGKPITIDLKSMFGPGAGRRGGPMSPAKVLSDMFRQASSKANPSPRLFSGIVDGLLSAIPERRKSRTVAEHPDLEELREYTATHSGVPKNATIIHVKDLRAIQDTSVGHQFLSELYDQVGRRRHAGECMLIVGTDSARDDQSQYTRERINDIQKGEPTEISQNIVLTPVFPNTTSKLALLHDRKQRIATINMRHLWETLRYRIPPAFPQLEPGFWRRDFLGSLTRSDKACLEAQMWSHSYVHRLATYIAGAEPPVRNIPGITDREDLQESLAAVQGTTEPIISAATAHLSHSDKTKIRWAEKQTKNAKVEVAEQARSSEDARLSQIRASASKYEKRLMSGIIESKNISTTFNDVHMPVETIDALQTLTALSLVRPEAFKYGVLASDKIPGLLLYGPPGTGKTLAAKAVAKESGATMLEVSAADINDMYVGEGEKNVKALFSLARKLSPCVVFLDEADAIFSARSNAGRRVSHRELLNQFLKEWDGMSNDSGSAFIMVATNRPMDLDDAVLRRLPRRLLVDLPTEADRFEILKIHLRHENMSDDVNLSDLAKQTPFYSGSDLKNVAVAAALNAVREENEAAKRHQGEEPYQYPEKRTLTAKHFDKALEEISASISEDMTSLRDIKKFDEQYGDKRGRKRRTPKWGFKSAVEADKVLDTVKVRS